MFKLIELVKATKAKLIGKSRATLFKGVSTDSRTIGRNAIFFALKGSNYDGHDFIKQAIKKGAKAIVVSRKPSGITNKINILKVNNTTLVLGRLAKHIRKINNIPLIAVTGSTGKTTTKDIIYDILRSKYKVLKNFGTHNNQIGVPQTIFRLNKRHNAAVLELGTNHFGEISYLSSVVVPQVAVITNIGLSHLEFLKDIKGVLKEKKSITAHLKGPKIVLLNGDDNLLTNLKLPKDLNVFYFGQSKYCDFRASNILTEGTRVSFVFNRKHKFRINTLGKFNIYNALAGIGCGLIFGVGVNNIKKALLDFQFPQRRLNKINCGNFCILDDSYNSNPLSLMKAVETLMEFKPKARKILVMGDMLELGKRSKVLHREIGNFIAQKQLDMLITLGELSRSTADTVRLRSKGLKDIFAFDSKIELIDFLKNKIKLGDALLIKGSRLLRMEDITASLIKMEKKNAL